MANGPLVYVLLLQPLAFSPFFIVVVVVLCFFVFVFVFFVVVVVVFLFLFFLFVYSGDGVRFFLVCFCCFFFSLS